MKKRKGVLLPLVIVISLFIMILGGIGLTIGTSGQKQSYGNMKNMQAYYLARAGIEMGMGFLYSPSDLNNSLSDTWFEKANSSQTLQQIENELRARTGDLPQNLEVFVTTTGSGDTRVITDSNIYSAGSTVPRQGEKFGDISVTVSIEQPTTGTATKRNSFYRIVSQASIQEPNGRVQTYSMTMKVSMQNEFDRDLRLGG